MTIGWLGVNSRTWPSGAAFTTALVPMVPVAPEPFSTITGLPHNSASLGMTSLAMRSGGPSGGNEMISTGFDGNASYPNAAETIRHAPAAAMAKCSEFSICDLPKNWSVSAAPLVQRLR